MRHWKTVAAAALLIALPSGLYAQIPAAPPVAAPPVAAPPAGAVPAAPAPGGAIPAVPAPAGAVPAAAAPTKNLWSFLFPSQPQKATFQQCLCKTQFGQMLTSVAQPFSMLSGGIVAGCCPGPNTPNPAGLAAPPTSIAGAAARIKQSEAEAAARRADVRYLGTADCHRWPEAEAALINALRADPNECVRWQAASSLGSGCCCTKNIIKALTLTVSCSKADGNPIETSWRVKSAACAALKHCLSCYRDVSPAAPVDAVRPEAPPPPRRPEAPGMPGEPLVPVPAPVVKTNADPEMRRVVEEGRLALANFEKTASEGHLPTGNHSVYHIVAKTIEPNSAATSEAASSLVRPPAESAPPPLLTEPQQSSRLPPTGQRDLFHLFIHTSRPDGAAAQANAVPSPGGSNR